MRINASAEFTRKKIRSSWKLLPPMVDFKVIVSSLIILALLILTAFDEKSADVSSYSDYYQRVVDGITTYPYEFGFYVLLKIFVCFGFSFRFFKVVVTLICFSLIYAFCRRFVKYPGFVLIPYFFYPFLLDATQMRHFICVSIFLFATKFLRTKNFKNLFIYVLLILVAASIHSIGWVLLVFLIVPFCSDKKATFIGVSFFAFGLLFYRFVPVLSLTDLVTGLRGSAVNYSSGIEDRQFWLYALFYIVLFFLAFLLRYGMAKYQGKRNNYLYRIVILGCAFIPLLLLNFQFTRVPRLLMLPIYTYIIYQSRFCVSKTDALFVKVFLILIVMATGLKLFGPSSGYWNILTIPLLGW